MLSARKHVTRQPQRTLCHTSKKMRLILQKISRDDDHIVCALPRSIWVQARASPHPAVLTVHIVATGLRSEERGVAAEEARLHPVEQDEHAVPERHLLRDVHAAPQQVRQAAVQLRARVKIRCEVGRVWCGASAVRRSREQYSARGAVHMWYCFEGSTLLQDVVDWWYVQAVRIKYTPWGQYNRKWGAQCLAGG